MDLEILNGRVDILDLLYSVYHTVGFVGSSRWQHGENDSPLKVQKVSRALPSAVRWWQSIRATNHFIFVVTSLSLQYFSPRSIPQRILLLFVLQSPVYFIPYVDDCRV